MMVDTHELELATLCTARLRLALSFASVIELDNFHVAATSIVLVKRCDGEDVNGRSAAEISRRVASRAHDLTREGVLSLVDTACIHSQARSYYNHVL